jgi:hypothetical protein
MTRADAGSRKLRRSWVRAHQRRTEQRRCACAPAGYREIARRSGWEHVSTVVARVMEGLARAGGLSL